MLWKAPICLGAFVLGIILSRLPWQLALGIGVTLTVVLFILHAPHERGLRLLLLQIVVSGFAAGLGSIPRPLPEGIVAEIEGRDIEGWGAVREFPRVSTTVTQVLVDVIALRGRGGPWRPVNLGMRLQFKSSITPQKGETIHFGTKPQRFHNQGIAGEFDIETREHDRGVFAAGRVGARDWKVIRAAGSFDRTLTSLRATILATSAARLSRESAGIFAGLVLGEQQRIDPRINQEWRDAGVTHLISISGLHLGIVYLIFRWLCLRLLSLFPILLLSIDAGWLSGLMAVPAVVFYSVISGSQAPTLRSLSMLLCVLAAQAMGRRSKGYEPLAWGALTVLALDPQILFSPGFQLSFTAIFGGLAWQHVVVEDKELSFAQKTYQYVAAALISSLVAMAWTTPIAAYLFGRGSAVALVANIPMIPYVSLILTPAAFLFACFAAFGIEVGFLWRWLDLAIIAANRAATFFASLPGAGIPFRLDGMEFSLMLAGLGAVSVAVVHRARRWRYRALAVLTAVVVMATFHEWRRWSSWRRPLRVDVLSIGQGDAILLTSNGQHALVDTGGGGGSIYQRSLAPYFVAERIGRLEVLLLTHPHEDHVGGAAELIRLAPPKKLVLPSIAHFRRERPDILAAAEKAGVAIEEWSAGEIHRFGQATITVLHPSAEFRNEFPLEGANWNNLSLVLRIEAGDGACVMLSGDAEHEAEEEIVASGLVSSCGLLKAGHHGSRTSSLPGLLDLLHPQWALISAGFENQFKHPHASTLRAYDQRHIEWQTTSEGGTLTAVYEAGHWEIQPYVESAEP